MAKQPPADYIRFPGLSDPDTGEDGLDLYAEDVRELLGYGRDRDGWKARDLAELSEALGIDVDSSTLSRHLSDKPLRPNTNVTRVVRVAAQIVADSAGVDDPVQAVLDNLIAGPDDLPYLTDHYPADDILTDRDNARRPDDVDADASEASGASADSGPTFDPFPRERVRSFAQKAQNEAKNGDLQCAIGLRQVYEWERTYEILRADGWDPDPAFRMAACASTFDGFRGSEREFLTDLYYQMWAEHVERPEPPTDSVPDHAHPMESVARSLILRGKNVIFWGPKAASKSYTAARIIRDLCGQVRYRVDGSGGLMEDAFLGLQEARSEDGATVTQHADGPGPASMRDGVPLLIEEIDALPSETLMCLASALQDGVLAVSSDAGRVVRAQPGWCTIGTANTLGFGRGRQSGYQRNTIDAALRDRFLWLRFDPLGRWDDREAQAVDRAIQDVRQEDRATLDRWSKAGIDVPTEAETGAEDADADTEASDSEGEGEAPDKGENEPTGDADASGEGEADTMYDRLAGGF